MNKYDFCDFFSKRTVTFHGYEVHKRVEFTDSKFADMLEDCYAKLDLSKFKSNIIDFTYERKKDKVIDYVMPLLDQGKFVGSDKNKNVNITCTKEDHIIQAYYDFIEPCDKGYPIHYDCALKNYFIFENNITFCDVDAFGMNIDRQALGLLFCLRVWQRLTRNNLQIDYYDLYQKLNKPKFDDFYYEHIYTFVGVQQNDFVKRGLEVIKKCSQ